MSGPGGTLLVAAAVVIHDGRVLLTKRPEGKHLGGLWEFPGGKVEAHEDPEHAVVRELAEECGVAVRVVEVLDVTFHAYPERDVLVLFYLSELVPGPDGAAPEVTHLGVADHVFARPDELSRYALPPADVRVVEKIRARFA